MSYQDARPEHDPRKKRIEIVNCLANVVIALGVVVAVAQYRESERAAQFDQTLRLLNLGPRLVSYTPEQARQADTVLINTFSDRFASTGNARMTDSAATKLYDASEPPRNEESPEYAMYLAARDELNHVAALAFSYQYDVGDRELLAAAECSSMVKSAYYFEPLIRKFGGPGNSQQSWQHIMTTIKQMQTEHPRECGLTPHYPHAATRRYVAN